MIGKLKYIILAAAVSLLSLTGIEAAPGDTVIGIDPVRDSISMQELRSYLAEIRKTRPTVALVLSGGGAKGASHIGVIEYLDSLQIPVDVVLGTSMGGLIGSLYSLGYSPSAMDSLIRTIDWSTALTDRVPRDYVSYNSIKYRERFLLSFPFYYEKKDYYEKLQNDMQYAGAEKKYKNIHFGAGKEDATRLIRNNLLGSLPSGFAFGQNVNNIISSLTVGYQDDIDFSELPLPFVCVATEMVTAKPKIWYEGKLNTALRSTMSIPGVFAPVKTEGMVLVDGGMRDNYPTDLAKEMGADIIIGVDLSSGFRDYTQLNNLGDIIAQGVDMLGRESYEKNMDIPDVTIKPSLNEFTMMSFDARSIDIIIDRGRQAARLQSHALDSIKTLIGPYHTELHNKPALDINMVPVRISRIEITGVSDKESRYLMSRISIVPNKKISKGAIEDAVATIFGTGAFDYVTYELSGTEEPFALTIHCKKGPVHQFGIGGRFDTEEIASVLLNFGFNVHKLRGSALDFRAKVGNNPYARLHYYYKTTSAPTFNVTTSFKWTDRNQFTMGTRDYTVAYLNSRTEAYISNIRWRKFDLRGGIRSDFYKLNNVMANQSIGEYDLGDLTNNYISVFGNMRADTFDDGYFPTKGFTLGLGYEWVFKGTRHKIEPFQIITFDFKTVFPGHGCFALMPAVYARYLVGDNPSVPYLNMMGGSMAGRYLDQQIPFIGIDYATPMENFLTVVRLDFRFRLFKNNYLTAMTNFSASVSDIGLFEENDTTRGIIGAGLKYSYNSIIGPIELDVHWASRQKTRQAGAYFNLGLYF